MRSLPASELFRVLSNLENFDSAFQYVCPRTGYISAADFYSTEEESKLLQHIQGLDYTEDEGDSARCGLHSPARWPLPIVLLHCRCVAAANDA